MSRYSLAFFVLAGLASLRAEDLPKAETILDRYIEVTGGKAAYEKIHNELSKGIMDFVGKGIQGPITSFGAEPNMAYTIAELEGVGKIEEGTDGQVFWERSVLTGPRIRTGDEREEVLRASVFNSHLNWRKLYASAETTGSEMVGDEDCYKVVLTPKTGKPVSESYSKKTGLLMKTSSVHATQMGEIPADGFFKDYREVPGSGIKMAFTHTNTFAGQEIAVHLTSIEFNVTLAKDRFDLPDDIKALVRKQGAADAK